MLGKKYSTKTKTNVKAQSQKSNFVSQGIL